jgi:vanillate O-demethylase ferredoxin subunit
MIERMFSPAYRGGMTRTVEAVLVNRVDLTDDVSAFTFEPVAGAFDSLEPGAHIDVHLDDDLIRSYSLTTWEQSGASVSIAVKREASGRGGSLAMHRLAVGDRVKIGGPRNNFELRSGEAPIVLLGGGIGITPIYAMARCLVAQGRQVEVRYFVRTHELAAFDAALTDLGLGESYVLHCDDQHGRPDFGALIADRSVRTQYYVCGPEVMLTAVREASWDLDRGTVFFERFAAIAPTPQQSDRPFEIVLESSGETFEVPADESILQVLRRAGKDVDYSCGEGTCGSCVLDVLGGEVDHRDSILTEDERAAGDCLCICVSRAKGSQLVLDL